MAKITFEEIMARFSGNKTAFAGLKERYKKNKTIPFVGAGLCVPFGYKQWSGLLKELATLLTDETRKTKANMMIELGELLEAAQEIRDHAGDLMFDALQQLVSIDIYKQCDVSVRQDSAVMLLPKLFPSTPVITTNFDQVLENVYTEVSSDYLNKCTPFDQPQLTQLSQKNAHILLKLHGDIGSGICSTDKLVFTKKQYEAVYAPEAPITEALFNLFQNNSMLFLGASLEQDRTTDILEAVHKKYPDTRHYAILSYPKTDSELKETRGRLDKLGVLPIFFPTRQYEAIRVILEELLGKSSPNPSAKLPQQNHSDTDKSPFARMAYDSDYVDFVGRAKEMSLLEEFCQKDDPILWWAVTAPGGSGKSRLVYEFTRKKEKEGWKIRWLSKADYTSQSVLDLPGEPCILVADDVQAYFDNLRQQLNQILDTPRVNDLRVILLERDGKDLQSASWGNKIMETPYDMFLSDHCYNAEFLQLKPLSDEDLMAAMVSYAKSFDQTIPENKAKELLAVLKRVDEELHRPLYAMAIADAWCRGEKPERWDRKQVLNDLLDRELRFYTGRLSSELSGLHRLPSRREYQELESLLAMSCITEPLLLESVNEKDYPKLNDAASALGMDLADLLEEVGIVCEDTKSKPTANGNGTVNIEAIRQFKAIRLGCPDLVKEYLVVKKTFIEKGWRSLLLPDGWMDDYRRFWCIRRLMIDYPDVLEQETLFLNAFFAAEPETDMAALRYSHLLFGFTVVIQKFAQRAVDRLEVLHKTFEQNEEIAFQYAKGLYNLTVEQDLAGCEDSVRKLQALHETDAFKENAEIALVYAKGLVNLSSKQYLAGCEDSVRELQVLHETEAFKENAEIALEYAKGLFNLSSKQDLAGRKDSVRKLQALHETGAFKENAEIALVYAKGLVNLSSKQDLAGCEDSVRELQVLHETEAFKENAEIALEYAKGLFNLSNKQDLAGRKDSVRKLQALHETEAFKKNAEIAQVYAKGLVNLTFEQDLTGCEDSVRKLKGLHETEIFKSDAKIAEQYASALVNLSHHQWQSGRPETEVEQTLSQVRKVESQFSGETEIQLIYAMTWFNLTLVQTGEARTATIQSLRKYLEANLEANQEFQSRLDTYLSDHPDQHHLYAPLRI